MYYICAQKRRADVSFHVLYLYSDATSRRVFSCIKFVLRRNCRRVFSCILTFWVRRTSQNKYYKQSALPIGVGPDDFPETLWAEWRALAQSKGVSDLDLLTTFTELTAKQVCRPLQVSI